MALPAGRRIAVILLIGSVVAACGSSSGSGTPPAVQSAAPPAIPSPAGTTPTVTATTPGPAASAAVAGPPTACMSLGEPDCARAAAAAIAALTPADPSPVYLAVGPFSCRTGEQCPPTLEARPEGDVLVEFAGAPAVSFHIVAAADGSLGATRGETFMVTVPPSSARLPGPGPIPFALGHCGLFSGIDVDGSWWDPVGPVDGNHSDTVNAANGTLTFIDPTHATFVSQGGLIVHLVRRIGPKQLPMCQ